MHTGSGRHTNTLAHTCSECAGETVAHITHFLFCSMVISCYEGIESQSNQAPMGMTLTSTPINSGAFIMMNAANIERMSHLAIDFKLWPNGKYDHLRQQLHMKL